MSRTDNSERDAEIYRLYDEMKMTFTAIGKRYGISRERVRQIVEKIKKDV
jgi:DNA-directed RNA polymerase sigma subunit (sigma70/sigma32)|tara:strand:+ start:265 stop:414 length:150 start_codon:yes stop_codon:yes gene_type:complete